MNIESYTISTDGTPSYPTDASAALHIYWSRAFDDVYCHHALLIISYTATSLFTPELAKVAVNVRNNTIEKGQISSYTDKKLSCYLASTMEDSHLIIPLNSTEILDALCENGWTKLKTGERGAPKSFPLSLEIEIESEPDRKYSFNHSEGKYPYTLSEPFFSSLKNGEIIETIIDFAIIDFE